MDNNIYIYSIDRRIAAIKFIRSFAQMYEYTHIGLKQALMLVDDHLRTGNPIDLGYVADHNQAIVLMAAQNQGCNTNRPDRRPLRIAAYNIQHVSDIPTPGNQD